MQPDNKEVATKSGLFSLLEQVGKIVIGVFAVSYGIGLMVTNQYLMTIGVSDYSSVRPKYVLTGLWALLFIISATIPLLIPVLFYDKTDTLRFRYQMLVVNFATTCGVAIGIDLAIFGVLHLDFSAVKISVLLVWLIGWWLELFLVMYAVNLALKPNKPRKRISGIVVAALLLCTGLAQSMHFIGENLYSHMPEASGGGESVAGLLILKKDGGVEFWKEAWYGQELKSEFRSSDVNLLYQDEHIMVITILHGLQKRRLVVSRSMVDAFVADVVNAPVVTSTAPSK
jgi:hypothetical protein